MKLIDRLRSNPTSRAGLVELFPTWANDTSETARGSFDSMSRQVFKQNGPVFAAIQARSRLFAEARFAFQRFDYTRYTTDALNLLENPWPGGTTADLLKRMEQDASLAGNAYIYKAAPDRLQRLRPDKVEVMSNGREVVGYLYHPNGKHGGGPVKALLREEVAHYTPIPDPENNWIGWSWVQTVLLEIGTDRRMTGHQDRFYQNAATPNLMVKIDSLLTDESRQRLRNEFDRRYGGWENAYKTVILDGGADMRAVGIDMQQSDFVASKAANENRIAQASGVPPVILGLQSGLENATYSNYEQALKHFATTLRALWRDTAAALSTITRVPADSRLIVDDSQVIALQDNAMNLAEIRQTHAATLSSLISSGFTPESAVQAVETGDLDVLEHTGLFSVQLQEAGEDTVDSEQPQPVGLETP